MSIKRIRYPKPLTPQPAPGPLDARPLPHTTATTATPPAELPAYLTTSQAAIYLQLNRRTIANWCADGTLHAVKIGDDWRIPREQVQQILTPA